MVHLAEEAAQSSKLARELMGSRKLQDALASISETYRNLAMPSRAIGALAEHKDLAASFKMFEQSGVLQQMAKVQADHDAMMKRIAESFSIGHLARQAELFRPYEQYHSGIADLMKALRADIAPVSLASARIADEIRRLQEPFELASRQAKEFADQIASIARPWSIPGSEGTSMAAALRLSQFSRFTRELPAFSRERFAFVDSEFGAFDRALPVAEAIDDEEEGEAVYTDAGRTQALVAFPSVSYDDVLVATGLTFDIRQPAFIRPDGSVLPEAAMNPHDHFLITMIEGHLRQAICTALAAAGGLAALQRLFGNRLSSWARKRDEALDRGEIELHLVYYADFMEMAEIVINKEMWASTFKPIFRNKDRLRISLERLHGLRIPTAHSRPLTRTARLRLWVEAREILEALGVVPAGH